MALALASSSNPRWVVRILAEAMKAVADDSRRKKQIDLKAIQIASAKVGSELDAKDWIILKYIRKNGKGSASDDGLREVLDFKKPKRPDGYHASVDRRLRAIAAGLRLRFDEVPTGTTKKHVLRLPEVQLD